MVLGPVEIEEDILQIGSWPQVYNRTPEFSNRLAEIHKNLQYVFQTKNPVVLAAASGTGMMEAAITNILSKGDTALYVNGGTFGERWGQICMKHGIKAKEIKLALGETVSPSLIDQELRNNPQIKAVLITHDETSTGTLTDIESIGKIVRELPDVILVVDSISALVVEKLEMDNWGLDIVVSSSHKAMSIPPGLSFISFSQKALKFAEKCESRLFYFDIFEYIKDWKKNQTPFTPPIGLLFQLEARLKKIKQEGLEAIQQRYSENTDFLRKGLSELGFNILSTNPANCVSAVVVTDYNAREIVNLMSEKHYITIAPSGGELETKLFRVGNFGNITRKDIERFLKALKSTLSELRDKTSTV